MPIHKGIHSNNMNINFMKSPGFHPLLVTLAARQYGVSGKSRKPLPSGRTDRPTA